MALTPTCAPDPWYPERPLPGFSPLMRKSPCAPLLWLATCLHRAR